MPESITLLARAGQAWRRTIAKLRRGILIWAWFNLRIASNVQEHIRRRFTLAGQALLGLTMTAALFGLDTRQTAAHQVFALAFALLLVAGLGSRRPPPGIEAERALPRYASVDEPCTYRVRLHHAGKRPVDGIDLREPLPDPRPDLGAFLRLRMPGEHRLHPPERLFGYPRWRWLVGRGRFRDDDRPTAIPPLVAGGRCDLKMTFTPRRRGVLRLGAPVLGRDDPFGLLRRTRPAESGGDRLIVLPKRWPVRPQPAAGRRRLQPGGISLAGAVGESREFIGLRDYLPGDSPRHIHWAAWARCGEPVVKEYQDEYFSRQALILDSFIGADDAERFETAVSVAASLLEPLHRAEGLLDLMFIADQAHTLTGGRGLLTNDAMLEVLACLEPRGREQAPGFELLAELVLGQADGLSACICVLLDWDPPRRALIHRLRARGIPVRALIIGTPDRTDVPAAGALAHRPAALVRVDPLDPGPALAAF